MITLITGGARSGKSAFALQQMDGTDDVAFIATAEAKDADMRERIERHQKERPQHWHTYEMPRAVLIALRTTKHGAYIIDCLSMLIKNLLTDQFFRYGEKVLEERPREAEEEILGAVRDIMQAMRENGGRFCVVTNEVGEGTVPETLPERFYCDVLGRANQLAAEFSDNVVLIVCGQPLWIKKSDP